MLVKLFIIGALLELGMYNVHLIWNWRKFLVPLIVVVVGFGSGLGFMEQLSVFGGLFLVSGLLRTLNLMRIAEARMHPAYLLRATKRSGWIFIAFHGLSLSLLLVSAKLPIRGMVGWQALAALQLAAAVGVFITTWLNLRQTRLPKLPVRYADKELPTVTVAIPARNETADLQACLQSLIANDYPKLEILVLDDCSQDRTPEIIRSFAHDGVRFIKGTEPAERWLAKNQAYDKLAQEANGDYILFCGVDVRFGPAAIRGLISAMVYRQKQMISVLPLRSHGSSADALVQPIRYWWELALPRKLVNRPPVLSTCWVIKRQALQRLGSFDAVRHAVIPEGFFARELVKSNSYSFLRAGDEVDIQTRKSLSEQHATAIRTHYPQIRRRPEMAMLLTFIDAGLLLAPPVLFVAGFFMPLGLAQGMAGLASLLLVATHVIIVRISDPANTAVALVNYPLAVIIELWLGLASMWKYEFSTVEWKGRNVCIPVMHSIPKLTDNN